MKPSVGRIVHFAGGDWDLMGGEDVVAAIITKVSFEDTVYLTVFAPSKGVQFLNDVPYSEDPNSGMRWFWPPRV